MDSSSEVIDADGSLLVLFVGVLNAVLNRRVRVGITLSESGDT